MAPDILVARREGAEVHPDVSVGVGVVGVPELSDDIFESSELNDVAGVQRVPRLLLLRVLQAPDHQVRVILPAIGGGPWGRIVLEKKRLRGTLNLHGAQAHLRVVFQLLEGGSVHH